MRSILRGLIGLVGVLGLLMALRIWMAPAAAAGKLGLVGQGPLGEATLRADVAGFFGVAGGLALYAAIRNRAGLLTAPLLLIGAALAGRIVTLAASGPGPDTLAPMLVEAVLVVILGAGRRLLPQD
ncbi:hypothetical protein [Phenylobacterium sp.]|uniref:hypothetical protein n=1 Tax=Phenylobacterium sp. TaxID=1871053 RepID=UPI0035AF4656